jgi:hypothetical protein
MLLFASSHSVVQILYSTETVNTLNLNCTASLVTSLLLLVWSVLLASQVWDSMDT